MLPLSIKKRISKLRKKKFRDELDEFIVEGIKGVQEAMHYAGVDAIIIEEGRRQKIEKELDIADTVIHYAARADIGSIKTTETFPGVLAIVKKIPHVLQDLSGPIIALDTISDPGNLGTIIRTADWFGIKDILLSEGSVDPYNEKVVRSSMGSLFRTHICESPDIVHDIGQLAIRGYSVFSISTKGQSISTIPNQKKAIYIFGSESHGIRTPLEEMSLSSYTIPGAGIAESLNIAVAAGITMYHIAQL